VAGLAAGPLAADSGNSTLPTRVLGKTGERVSILAFGGGSRYLMYKAEDQALAAITRALDLGITYIDSADDYGSGHLSEQRIGKAIKGRRNGIFLVSKVTPRSGDEAKRAMELSLKALDVDHLDLLHIHQLADEDDLRTFPHLFREKREKSRAASRAARRPKKKPASARLPPKERTAIAAARTPSATRTARTAPRRRRRGASSRPTARRRNAERGEEGAAFSRQRLGVRRARPRGGDSERGKDGATRHSRSSGTYRRAGEMARAGGEEHERRRRSLLAVRRTVPQIRSANGTSGSEIHRGTPSVDARWAIVGNPSFRGDPIHPLVIRVGFIVGRDQALGMRAAELL
jgi:hypothetical protein